MKKQLRYVTFLLITFLISCSSKEEYVEVPNNNLPESPVVFNPDAAPFQQLSEYRFFEGNLKDLAPSYGVIPYEPINTLFTDYAHKKRFIWMPENVSASYVNDFSTLNFPIGTVLIKNFYYDTIQPNNTTRIIETRLMYNTSEGWKFAEYVWNDAQTEAYLDMNGSTTDINFMENGVVKSTSYRIPSEAECFTCHKDGVNATPIALKPQNINKNLLFSDGNKNQLSKWIEMGYLNDNLPNSINTIANWEDTSLPIQDRMRGYLDINCAHCHSDNKHCDYRPIRLAFGDYVDESSLGACVPPDTEISPYTDIIVPNNVARSVMHFRLSTTQEEYKMPLLGRTLVHEEGVQLLEDWINSLTITCD